MPTQGRLQLRLERWQRVQGLGGIGGKAHSGHKEQQGKNECES